jgi:photosystem II stability/assembly factor-like uncharacterized protein
MRNPLPFPLKILIWVAGIFLTAGIQSTVSAQQTQAHSQDPSNFYEVKKVCEDYWKGRNPGRGEGYKPFKRWEWFWEQRVGRSGLFPPNEIIVREWDRYTPMNPSKTSGSSSPEWSPMGPFSTNGAYEGMGRINCIAFHPTDPNTFWVGTPSGGLWKTTDYGGSWSTNYDNNPVLGVSDMVIDPDNPTVMYLATGDGDLGSLSGMVGGTRGDNKSIGVLKSTDAGESWNPTGLSWVQSSSYLIRRIVMNPLNHSILYAATSCGIFMTSDGGMNWNLQQQGYFTDIAFKPGNPLTLYASSQYPSPTVQIYRTTDGGNTWNVVTSFGPVLRIKLAVTPQDPDLVEAVCVNIYNGLEGIYRSTDSGASFARFFTVATDCSNNLLNFSADPLTSGFACGGQGRYDLCYLINPSDINERWIGGVNIWKSSDAGQNWTLVAYFSPEYPQYPTVHCDHHWFAFHPLQPETFFTGNDGGVHYSKNGGASWRDISNGLQIGQIYKIGNSYTNPEILISGFQDNNSQIDSAGTWIAPYIIGGDGMDCFIDYLDPNTKYASNPRGFFYRTRDAAWNNTVTISDSIPGRPKGSWVTPFIMHPSDPDILYAGFRNIYRTEDQGDRWQKISALPDPDQPADSLVRNIMAAPSNPSVMVSATLYNIYRTRDEWMNYSEIEKGLPVDSVAITGIAVHALHPDTLWVTFSGYCAGKKVYRSSDGGNSWTNLSGTLPNIPVNCICFQKDAGDALYIGTDIGVFVRTASMNDWQLFGDGLPNVVVTDLEIQYMSGKIRAATYGRGLWESDLFVSPGTVQINAIPLPMNGGIASGQGVYNPGDNVTLRATPVAGRQFLGWYENGNAVSETPVYSFQANETRNLTALFSYPESVSPLEKKSIRIFPNPSAGLLQVVTGSELPAGISRITTTDMNGNQMMDRDASGLGDHFTLDLSGYPPGNYILCFLLKSGQKMSCKIILSGHR